MEPIDTKKLREQWEAEIRTLLKQRTEIDHKIVGFETMIKGLDYVERGALRKTIDPVPLPPKMAHLLDAGLTEAVRMILEDSLRPLSPSQIRERLEMYGYEKLPAKNPMAAIHGVLRRMHLAGDVGCEQKITGKKKQYYIVAGLQKAIRAMGLDINPDLLPDETRAILGNVQGLSQPGKSALKADRIARAKDEFRKK